MPTDNDSPVTLDELASILRAHEGPPHARPRPSRSISSPPRWRPRLRWTLVAVALALLAGSGLGFGLGNSVTPSGNAGTSLVGFGFLPVRGWTVVQSGVIDSTGAATAIAATVPLHPDDDLRGAPYATLESLPATGVLIRATFTTRGDPGEDFKYPVRRLPLEVAGADPVPLASDPLLSRSLAKYRLAAGVGGHNVDVEIYFAAAQPSAKVLAAAQRQLSRLVVGSERVTIFARPTVRAALGGPLTLFGSVDSGKADEIVTIQSKQCGHQFFTGVAAARTREGGAWSTIHFPFPLITRTFRAVWRDAASAQITVHQRVSVRLSRTGSATFEVVVGPRRQFWRKRVLLQRFDRRLGTWASVKSVVLTKQETYAAASGTAKISVPKGTLVRAVFPSSQARPCFLGGTSKSLRT